MNHATARNEPFKGKLAASVGYDLDVVVLTSGNGRFYLGTASRMAGPVSRESVEYCDSREEAIEALETGDWTQRDHP